VRGIPNEEALSNVRSAIQFHVETFSNAVFEEEEPIMGAFVSEAQVPI